MGNHVVLGVAMALAAVVLSASPARSADLTGIWLGEQTCDRFDGEKFTTRFANDVMVISQNGEELNMAALLIDGAFQLLYQGRVIDDARDPEHKGQAAFIECTTTPTSPYQETGSVANISGLRRRWLRPWAPST